MVSQQDAVVHDTFQPIRLLEVDLSSALPPLASVDPATGLRHGRALVLVRLHSQPLGVVRLEYSDDGFSAEEFSRSIWDALHEEILAHLRADGLPAVTALGSAGLPGPAAPPCTRERRQLLADAPPVSVIIPTRDRPEHVDSCLASLAALDYPDFDIIIVDNAPATQATAEVVARWQSKLGRLRYVREDRPGASWARNRGLQEARTEIVAFTDDDVIVDRHWLAELVKGFDLAPNVGCVTGNVLPQRLDTPAQAWFEERGGFGRGFQRQVHGLAEQGTNHPLFPYAAMAFGSGNNMAFRASVLRALGGFDPALDPASPSLGGEDLAAFFEVVVRGYELVYEPAAMVRHLHRRDYAGLQRQVYSWGVGFSAFLFRSLVRHPGRILDFASRLPYALRVLLKGKIPYDSDRAEALVQKFPGSSTLALRRVEYRGYLHGVPAYLRSWWQVRRLKAQYGGQSVV